MSQDWYLMTTPNQMSGFENEYFTDYATNSFNELLATFIGEDVIIYNSTMTTNTIVKGIVQSKYQKQNEMQILLPLNSCEIGMYVKYKNLYWLIIDFVNDNKMYQKAIIQICNYTIKFQSTDGTILSYPCVTNNRVQGTGDTDTKVMTLPAGRKIILLPHDENTTLLRNDRRLFIDLHPTQPRPYEIDFVDSTKFNYGDKGLLEIYVTEDQLQSDDRVDLGICNYFEPTVEPEPPVEGYSYATIVSSGDLTVGGFTRTITPTFYESDSTLADGIIAVWDIDLPLGYENQFTITYVGNQVKIKVAENYDLIEKAVTFNVMGSNGGYGGSLTLMITV